MSKNISSTAGLATFRQAATFGRIEEPSPPVPAVEHVALAGVHAADEPLPPAIALTGRGLLAAIFDGVGAFASGEARVRACEAIGVLTARLEKLEYVYTRRQDLDAAIRDLVDVSPRPMPAGVGAVSVAPDWVSAAHYYGPDRLRVPRRLLEPDESGEGDVL